MFGLFKPKPILSQEDTDFQIATFKWLLTHFGGEHFYQETQLILPTRDYFPAAVKSANEAALETFNTVKKYAGMETWPCKLEAQEQDIDARVAPTVFIENLPGSPNGTFEITESKEVVITYNPALVKNPTQLVATYAHELAHYLTGTVPEPPPGGWVNWEFATDITATFLGFGVFMANSTFNFRQFTEVGSQGWQASRSGYLTEAEHVFSLALFLGLKGLPVQAALPYLKPNLKRLLRRAVRYLADTQLIQELSAIEYVPFTQNSRGELKGTP
ncbi:hypothetical protein [Rheinheimera sp. WS51]|uniref:hypothetical protein n=1 Tax=Rheinheimera sp. WS51 TaxID=3425886 RepID=UPI003D936B78